jgi:hypothetical protein
MLMIFGASLLSGIAAIHHENCTRKKARVITSHVSVKACDFRGTSYSSDRVIASEHVPVSIWISGCNCRLMHDGSVDSATGDGVNADTLLCIFNCNLPCKLVEGSL